MIRKLCIVYGVGRLGNRTEKAPVTVRAIRRRLDILRGRAGYWAYLTVRGRRVDDDKIEAIVGGAGA